MNTPRGEREGKALVPMGTFPHTSSTCTQSEPPFGLLLIYNVLISNGFWHRGQGVRFSFYKITGTPP
ncbi:hypothetical protein BDV30DRAFT_91663 [Aspergillus minisclerotigenes]|uniref:Uncharacterized protein n=1 Tax=Aspergillus minisclerotigenes TaxID=656917 RepID=A0A5N6J6J5_9EURO|nr:hypothetical protein BDV30DRAFT_91663 [Aspergillus minisclerotigenes]